jgi:hypothetical protein
MSEKLHSAITAVLAMPYFKNQHARSGTTDYGHERAVADVLKEHGYNEHKREDYPKLKKGSFKKWLDDHSDTEVLEATAGLPNDCFILQPAGTQSFPDVILKDSDGRLIPIECKSGQNGTCPMWNDNLPKLNAIYVLASGLMNQTTVFMGQDVITQEDLDLMRLQEQAVAKVTAQFNAQMASVDVKSRGWIQKQRKQHFQGGGAAKTNYFTHKDRRQCEENVLQYVLGK